MIGNIASEWLNKQAGIMTRSFKQIRVNVAADWLTGYVQEQLY